MKKMATLGLAALLMLASAGFTGYRLVASRNADTPECCKNKEACCPGSSCCPKGEHSTRHCPMRV